MTTYQSRMMNIARQGAGRVDVFDFDSFNTGHRIGHRDARHAAADIAVEADAEISRLQAQLAESRQQTDALFNTGMTYCDKIEALQAQVDALADALVSAESALSDIGDADREPGDDLHWCENRAAEALPAVRDALSAIGALT